MGFKSEGFSYEMLWRPNYALHAALAWFASAGAAALCAMFSSRPSTPFWVMFWFCLVMGIYRAVLWPDKNAAYLWWRQHLLKGRPLYFITVKEMQRKLKNEKVNKGDQWIGKGFVWEHRHAQLTFDLLKSDFYSAIQDPNAKQKMGMSWMHGIEPHEIELWQPIKHIEGHTLITGQPGSGKTRLFDLLISQAIFRGESVLIIDPKGDKEMRDNAKRAAESLGIGDRFVYFHPAFPSESWAIDPLKNFTRSTELASRISVLMPQGGSSASFTSFAWETMNKICQALLICDDNPTLLKIRHHIELGVHELLMRTIRMYTMKLPVAANPQSLVTEFDLKVKDAETRYSKMEKPRSTEETFVTQEACKFYKERLAKDYCSPEIEALISLFEHDHAHFSKMIAPLLPVLSMLTTGAMGNLLSPGREQALHTFDTKSMLEEQKIVCIGLDSLSDATVGHMVGSLLLSDLASVAGSRFNFEDPHNLKPINVFVDESAEVLNEPFIQLLNKGRGAGMRLFVATQTISDFAAKLESDALKSMILGNLNNKFALRTYDLETQKYLSEQMPKTHVKYVQRSQGMTNNHDSAFQHSSNISESLTEEETELFPQPLFGLMPNLEYIAIISGGVVMKGRIPILIGDKEKEVVKTRKLERAVARRKAYQIINEGVHDGGNDF